MDFFMDFLKRYWTYIVMAVLLLLLIGTTSYFLISKKSVDVVTGSTSLVEEIIDEEATTIKVDVKGAVKSPGVYELSNDNIIDDAIKAAGGLSSKAYSKNINLSKKLTDEMVIYVYTKTEYNKMNEEPVDVIKQEVCSCPTYEITECITEGSSVISSDNVANNTNQSGEAEQEKNEIKNDDVKSKVSINTATKEELMTLTGIGESKANNIITYRTEFGVFKTIEEIKNVSGIGDAAYEKIKDSITL